MIGPRTLKSIRDDLQRALSEHADDPILWLEQRVSQSTPEGDNEVLKSLQRFLTQKDAPPRPPRRKKSKPGTPRA